MHFFQAIRLTAQRPYILLASLVVLSGCVAVQAQKRDLDERGRSDKDLVFPLPPDEPRFIFERAIRGSLDIIPEKESSAIKRALTGVDETSGMALGKPYAVAVHQGKIYVSDSVNRAVMVFDIPARKVYTAGDAEGDGQIYKPLGLDLDRHGNLYVADATRKAILAYDPQGKYRMSIVGKDLFDRLSSVTVDQDGERILVVDIGGVSSENHRVRIFDAKTGKHLFDIGKRGSGPGEFNLPRDVAIGKDKRIYVVDGGNFRVQVFDWNGKFIKEFGSIGKQLGNFARPKEIATDKQGNVYVVDTAFGNFQIFDPEGELLMFIGDRNERDLPAKYMLPSGIAVDEDGRVYFVDQWFKRLDVFRPIGMKATEGYLGAGVLNKEKAEKSTTQPSQSR